MPPGVPVACVAVGRHGAANAGHLASQILALHDADLAGRVLADRARRAESVMTTDAALGARLRELLDGE
jgi:5-(carboxyamino)imidazole ribonucleotide mutase